jgi:hypothetical protein
MSIEQAYEVYGQPKHPEIDMFTHLPRWLRYLEQRLGRPFEPDDCIFPYIAPNGVVHAKQPISYDSIQDLLQEFASEAQIPKTFTTHCFRRGGAQYRFMYAAPEDRWALSTVQWWGGWAVGEGVSHTLSPRNILCYCSF